MKYFGNENITDRIVQDIAKMELRRKCIALNAYKRKLVRLKTSELSEKTEEI